MSAYVFWGVVLAFVLAAAVGARVWVEWRLRRLRAPLPFPQALGERLPPSPESGHWLLTWATKDDLRCYVFGLQEKDRFVDLHTFDVVLVRLDDLDRDTVWRTHHLAECAGAAHAHVARTRHKGESGHWAYG